MKNKEVQLKNKIKKHCKRYSSNQKPCENLNKASHSEINTVGNKGKPSRRLMIILTAKGCEWAKKGGPCTMCNYWVLRDPKVKSKNLINQLKSELTKHNLNKVDEISLFVSGSFLNKKEISLQTQKELIKILSKIPSLRKITIESRARYVSNKSLAELKKVAKDKTLEVALGLESSNDFIRNVIINKGLSKEVFEKALKAIALNELALLIYILIKPPFLTEKEAIRDAIKTANYVSRIAKKYKIKTKIDFEPTHIKPKTLVKDLYLAREYTSPWLWTIIQILKKLKKHKNIQVLLSTEGYKWYQKPKNCKKCSKKVTKAINKFNIINDFSIFENLDCECKEKWKKEISKRYKSKISKRAYHYFK